MSLKSFIPRDLPWKYYSYCYTKSIISPILALNRITPDSGNILDIGCGIGFSTHIIALNKGNITVEGIDIDTNKVAVASCYFEDEKKSFQVADVCHMEIARKYDSIVISDTFYLISPQNQARVIKKTAESLSENGTLIVKEIDSIPKWKFFVNYIQETFMVKGISFTSGDQFYFMKSNFYEEQFSENLLSFKKKPFHHCYCYPHVFYIGRKRKK